MRRVQRVGGDKLGIPAYTWSIQISALPAVWPATFWRVFQCLGTTKSRRLFWRTH